MDAQAKKNAAFRAKLKAQKQEKQRIDSPLVRYNENDQPVCKVCEVVVKSEALWPAHLVSQKHHEAVNKLRASAASLNKASNVKPQPPKEKPTTKSDNLEESHHFSDSSDSFPQNRASSMLPPGFFDNDDAKRQKNDRDSGKLKRGNSELTASKGQVKDPFASGSETDRPTATKSMGTKDPDTEAATWTSQTLHTAVSSETKQVKGALPQGFFDDKDADLRARGITPVQPDVKDEYKEFEKLIQEDLQEIDNRYEEEVFDAADTIEAAESVEQWVWKEKLVMLKRKRLELKAARSVMGSKGVEEVTDNKDTAEQSSSDDDSDENLTVDWRAKHL